MNITKPIIRKIKDNETALAEFEKEIKTNEAEDTKDIIMNFPTVYIHNWPETNKYDVYVGESNNIFARTRQHYQTRAVIFTSGYATKALKEMDIRIQIFDMEEMILLLNANLGERWYADFERLKSNFVKN